MNRASANGELRRYCEVLTESESRLLFSLRRHMDGNCIARVLAEDLDRLVAARDKHADFACGQYEALANLEAEAGEVAQEIVKGREGWEARMDEELKDVRVVALRMSLREYGHGEEMNGR